MRREIASKLRRAASVLRTVMLWASLALWLAIAATALIVVLAVGLAAYFAFWLARSGSRRRLRADRFLRQRPTNRTDRPAPQGQGPQPERRSEPMVYAVAVSLRIGKQRRS